MIALTGLDRDRARGLFDPRYGSFVEPSFACEFNAVWG